MLKYYIATGKTETDILAEYGVHVSGSTGLLGRPDFKNTPTIRNLNIKPVEAFLPFGLSVSGTGAKCLYGLFTKKTCPVFRLYQNDPYFCK